jgi:hypothetical protein
VTGTTLRWNQVNAWRLAQHGLAPRLSQKEAAAAVSRACGIQAQVMSAAELAIGARVDGLKPADVQAALWQERSLVKTWAMRGALHLVTASELPLFVAARSLFERSRTWVNYFRYFGISPELYQVYLRAAREVLGSQPLTREQFAQAMAQETGSAELKALILTKGWGTPLKPLAWRGDLCFGPNQGRNVAFVNPAKWLGQWQPVEPYPALRELARRYLRAYGPANPENFAHWWDGGTGLTVTRQLFLSMAEELEPVEVEGWQAFALRDTLADLRNLEGSQAIRLLPLFDAYTLGLGRGQELAPILAREVQARVYRPQGWISAVVLEGGFIRGTWESLARPGKMGVTVKLFAEPTPALKAGIESEVQRLSDFWNARTECKLETD